jgi:hypothetical protein
LLDWESVVSVMLEFCQAHEHWRRITAELKDRALMSPYHEKQGHCQCSEHTAGVRDGQTMSGSGGCAHAKIGDLRSTGGFDQALEVL